MRRKKCYYRRGKERGGRRESAGECPRSYKKRRRVDGMECERGKKFEGKKSKSLREEMFREY